MSLGDADGGCNCGDVGNVALKISVVRSVLSAQVGCSALVNRCDASFAHSPPVLVHGLGELTGTIGRFLGPNAGKWNRLIRLVSDGGNARLDASRSAGTG